MRKTYIVLVVVIAVLGAGSYFTERAFLTSTTPLPAPSTPKTTGAATHPTPSVPTGATPALKKVAPQTSIATQSATPTPNVVFSVPGISYRVFLPTGGTVLEAMRALASSSSFTFTGREYPSLGFFVESISGKKSADGMYWFLYLNGKSSQTGVSQTVLNPGDRVEWRYEKSY